jgi:hypothetical protein
MSRKIAPPMKTEPEEEPRRVRANATTESIALVASNGKTGVVLACDGRGIEYFVDGLGGALDDLGLDDAPEGLSIWEGVLRSTRSYEGEHDAHLEGAFRPLTAEERARVVAGEEPWIYETEQAVDEEDVVLTSERLAAVLDGMPPRALIRGWSAAEREAARAWAMRYYMWAAGALGHEQNEPPEPEFLKRAVDFLRDGVIRVP